MEAGVGQGAGARTRPRAEQRVSGLSLHLRVRFLWYEGVEKVIPQFSADAKPCRGRHRAEDKTLEQKLAHKGIDLGRQS